MSKRAKTVVRLWLKATTVKRIASPEYIQCIENLFEGVSSVLLPTDIVLYEGRGGRRPFSIDDLKAHGDWDPRSTNGIELGYRGKIRGGIGMSPHWGNPLKWGHGSLSGEFHPPPGGNTIGAHFDLSPLVREGLFDDAMRLFRNMIEFTQACHARASIVAVSTAKYIVFDNPEYSKAYAVEWNGVLIEPRNAAQGYRDGVAVRCLPCFENWINVLGREYVEFLGRDKVMALDVYRKHEDSGGRLWLQITERPEQMYLPEVREHVKHLMDSLDAPDVFCREPRTEEERPHSIHYRRPDFDFSGLQPLRYDPFSRESGRTGITVGRTPIWFSEGYLEQISRKHQHHLEGVIWTLLKIAVPKKGTVDPVGVALADDDELLQVSARDREGRTLQEQADLVVERLALMREKRPIKATGVCVYGEGLIPGDPEETMMFQFHVESAEGNAYVLYLPFEQNGRKREYGTLIIEPGERVVFANTEPHD